MLDIIQGMALTKRFFRSLIRYGEKKLEFAAKNTEKVVIGFVVIVLLSSLLQFTVSKQATVLTLGVKPGDAESLNEAIFSAARMGDYETARYLYSLLPILDVLGSTNMETEVYPEIVLKKRLEVLETASESYPEYRDLLLRMAILSYQLIDDEKSNEYLMHAARLDPNSKTVQQVLKDLKN